MPVPVSSSPGSIVFKGTEGPGNETQEAGSDHSPPCVDDVFSLVFAEHFVNSVKKSRMTQQNINFFFLYFNYIYSLKKWIRKIIMTVSSTDRITR